MSAISEKQRFREVLIARMDMTGVTAAELARRTGIAKSQIDKLRQRKVETTNVYDAMLISRFFGQPIEEFIGMTKRADKLDEVKELISMLTPEAREMVIAQIRAVVAMRIRSANEPLTVSFPPSTPNLRE